MRGRRAALPFAMMRRHRSAALLAVLAGLLLTAAPTAAATQPAAVTQPTAALPAAVTQPTAALPAAALPTAGPPAAAQPPQGPSTTTPFQTPDTSSCPNRVAPPAPVDLSEAPEPGQPAPTPIAVREHAVGGERMAECGLILPADAPQPPADLTPYGWLLADLDSGAVLATRDPHGRHRAASTIKILTALVAIRELELDRDVVGTEEDANQEGSRVGIGPAGQYTVDQLLHGLLMRSGNDAAHALSRQLGGVSATVQKMNALARDLGALDTRAVTPSGLDGAGASTSAYDLALIFRVAMREPAFAAIVGTALYDFPGFQDKPGFKVANDNKLLANYPGALGGKTGFTDDARHTYVGAAQRDGRRLLVVMLRGEQRPARMWDQAARLLDYGFALLANTRPVGLLVHTAPPENHGSSGRVAPNAQQAAGPPVAAGPAGDAGRHHTIYLAALLVIAVALAATLWWRRTTPARR